MAAPAACISYGDLLTLNCIHEEKAQAFILEECY